MSTITLTPAEEHPLGQRLAAAERLYTTPSLSRPQPVCLLRLLQEGEPIPPTHPSANPHPTQSGFWEDSSGYTKVAWQDGVILHGIQDRTNDEWEIHFIVCFGTTPERALYVAEMLAGRIFTVLI